MCVCVYSFSDSFPLCYCSVAMLCLTLCYAMDCSVAAWQAPLSSTISWSHRLNYCLKMWFNLYFHESSAPGTAWPCPDPDVYHFKSSHFNWWCLKVMFWILLIDYESILLVICILCINIWFNSFVHFLEMENIDFQTKPFWWWMLIKLEVDTLHKKSL